MRRILHWVFKVPRRPPTIAFYRDILGMKILRHEEFQEGCDAACNGPYDGQWSKTMVGYGPEDNHFVVELTYNYGVKEYKFGNDFANIVVHSKQAFANAKAAGDDYAVETIDDNTLSIAVTGGYKFQVHNIDVDEGKDPVQGLTLNVTDLERSVGYWQGILGMSIDSKTDKAAQLVYGKDQAFLRLQKIDEPLDHGTAYGRVAFACPADELPNIQSKIEEAGHKVLTPLISLDTPGKATVQVVILADPDGYEICFVGDEAFRELSKVDPEADKLLNDAMEKDGSDEWYAKYQERMAKIEAAKKAEAEAASNN